MRPNTSYPLRTRKPPRAPAFDQFSEEFYDRAGAKSLLTTANWHAEAVQPPSLSCLRLLPTLTVLVLLVVSPHTTSFWPYGEVALLTCEIAAEQRHSIV